jgi:serine/threonine-protein kinase ATR
MMAALQTALEINVLAEAVIRTWWTCCTFLSIRDIGPYVGPISAALIRQWNSLNPLCRELAGKILDHMITSDQAEAGDFGEDIASLDACPDLAHLADRLRRLKERWTPLKTLEKILDRCISENIIVASQALSELLSFMTSQWELMRKYTSGDVFHPIIGKIARVLFVAASRDGENWESLRLLSFQAIGTLGALDPDRFDMKLQDNTFVVLHNFNDDAESFRFAIHLIRDVLVGAFRSTSDTRYQKDLGFAIQELLKFCGFTLDLVNNQGPSVPLKIRKRWDDLPKDILEIITPLLKDHLQLNHVSHNSRVRCPIYSTVSTYREWIQQWSSHLIQNLSKSPAGKIFNGFCLAVRNKDVDVARHILPHLALSVLISGEEAERQNIRLEILAILEDQANPTLDQSADKRLLCAQVGGP